MADSRCNVARSEPFLERRTWEQHQIRSSWLLHCYYYCCHKQRLIILLLSLPLLYYYYSTATTTGTRFAALGVLEELVRKVEYAYSLAFDAMFPVSVSVST